jgi:SPP1 gp7 family putative phage head morphogenesis protein
MKYNYINGKPLPYPDYIEIEYHNKMLILIERMEKDVGRELVKLAKSPEAKAYSKQSMSDGVAMDMGTFAALQKKVMNALFKKWTKVFNQVAKPWSETLITKTDKASKQGIKNSTEDLPLNSVIAANAIPPALKQSIRTSINENVELIKSLPNKYLTDLKGDMDRLITGTGASMEYIQDQIARNMINRNGQIERRARNIATDQVRKVYADMNNSRLQKAGITHFEWRHRGGSKEPRPLHLHKLNGNIYAYNDPPVIDERTGQRGLPSQLPNCKCSARPVYRYKED